MVALVCTLAVVHTYLLYPAYLFRRAAALPPAPATGAKHLPTVHILMAVHNEELVLAEKLRTIDQQQYPGPLRLWVADDCSTDATARILADFTFSDPARRFHYHRNPQRSGKPASINALAALAGPQDVYLLTDASVMLPPTTVALLIAPLAADPALGLVDSCLVHTGAARHGISTSEVTYINREVALKQAEGRVLGYPIGPFGGCWAIRGAAYRPVPPNYLVDDFFLCMSAYRLGWRGESSSAAVVYEAVGQELAQEFRRKVRIGSGNWQNLVHFSDLWWPPFQNGLAFAFFSHKVLRWLTPFLLLLIGCCLLLLWRVGGNYWAGALLAIAVLVPLTSLLVDRLLVAQGRHVPALRHLNYFVAMNAALLVGFVRYLNGISTNVWQPSSRIPPDDGPPKRPR